MSGVTASYREIGQSFRSGVDRGGPLNLKWNKEDILGTEGSRRGFLRRLGAMAGVSVLPHSLSAPVELFAAPYAVDFVTRFPRTMTLDEYRSSKSQFENKDKVTTLLSAFRKTGKIRSEDFSFHGDHSVWRVTFGSEKDFMEWMGLTEETGSHLDEPRETAGFVLEIRVRA